MTQPTPPKALFNGQIQLPLQQTTNTSQILAEKISRINAEQIELIGMELVFLIPPNLGPIGKSRVEQMVMHKQKTGQSSLSEQELMLLVAQKISCEEATQQGELAFFSGDKYEEFTSQMHHSIKTALENAFSIPQFFVQCGMSIQLSDHEAQDILYDVCEKVNIDIDFNVPAKYFIELNLDTKLSQEQSTLVFILTQKSKGVEFSRSTFTIEMLTNALLV